MTESPVRKYRKRIVMTDDQVVDAIVKLVVAERKNRFKAADLERWSDSRLLPSRTVLMKRFDEGDGHGILRLQHIVADRLLERGLEPAPLRSLEKQPTRRDPLGLPKALKKTAQLAKDLGLNRPLTRSELQDASIKYTDAETPQVISGYYPGLSEAEAIRFFQKDVAAVMNVPFKSTDGRNRGRNMPKPEWESETMLSAFVKLIREENLAKPPTVREYATYAREGKVAGVNIVERRYVSESGTGMKALQLDAAIAMDWPSPARTSSNNFVFNDGHGL